MPASNIKPETSKHTEEHFIFPSPDDKHYQEETRDQNAPDSTPTLGKPKNYLLCNTLVTDGAHYSRLLILSFQSSLVLLFLHQNPAKNKSDLSYYEPPTYTNTLKLYMPGVAVKT